MVHMKTYYIHLIKPFLICTWHLNVFILIQSLQHPSLAKLTLSKQMVKNMLLECNKKTQPHQ